MTTNKPEVVAYHHINKENPGHRGVSLHHDASCTSTSASTEPLIRLSDYEALQAECEKLHKDADRYRWLRAIGGRTWTGHATQKKAINENFDAAIDAAMQTSPST